MKSFSKKSKAFIALAAVLVLTAVLVIGCIQPLDFLFGGVPEGYGTVRVKLGDEIKARTIIPAAPTLATFATYVLTFDDGTNPPTVLTRDGSDLNDSIILAVGTYNLEIVAYMTSGTPPTGRAASVEETGISVTAGPSGLTINTTLEMDDPVSSTETGEFAWNLTLPTGLTAATINVTARASGGGTNLAPDLTVMGTAANNSATPQTPVAGYYDVLLTLTKGPDSIYLREVLHIYQNMRSTWAYSVPTDLYFPSSGGSGTPSINPPTMPTVLFNLTDGTDPVHSTTITLSKAGPDTVTLEIPTGASNIDWYLTTALTPLGNGDSLTIGAGLNEFAAEGDYIVYVFGDVDGSVRGAWVRIVITA